jgi:hypothetical protein
MKILKMLVEVENSKIYVYSYTESVRICSMSSTFEFTIWVNS